MIEEPDTRYTNVFTKIFRVFHGYAVAYGNVKYLYLKQLFLINSNSFVCILKFYIFIMHHIRKRLNYIKELKVRQLIDNILSYYSHYRCTTTKIT